jgi:hypothetical protein
MSATYRAIEVTRPGEFSEVKDPCRIPVPSDSLRTDTQAQMLDWRIPRSGFGRLRVLISAKVRAYPDALALAFPDTVFVPQP